MVLPNELASKSADELEEWFLTSVEEPEPPMAELLDVLSYLVSRGASAQASSWAELLQDTLGEKGDSENALKLLQLRHGWQGDRSGFRDTCVEAITATFRSRLHRIFVKNAGLDSGCELLESLRRLDVMLRFAPGMPCHDNTWGFGVIKRVDDFYEKIIVDFSSKPSHEMSLSYGAEALELISDDHILARKSADPDALKELVQNDPGEVVRIALRSYGPLTAAELQEKMIPDVLEESDWKRFWDQARRSLKADAMVEMPTKRSEPIQLRDGSVDYEAKWYSDLEAERDPARILVLIEELNDRDDLGEQPDDRREIVANRLAFAIWGSEQSAPALAASALLMAESLGLAGDDGKLGERQIDLDGVSKRLLTEEALLRTLEQLPARRVAEFLAAMRACCVEDLERHLLVLVPRLPYSVLCTVIDHFDSTGGGATIAERLSHLFGTRTGSTMVVLWLCRNMERASVWGIMRKLELVQYGLECIESPASGEVLRAQNQLRALFESTDWLAEIMDELAPVQREGMVHRILASRGWDEVGRRSVLAGVVKRFPDLQKALVREGASESEPRSLGRVTSWRAYRERQEQLRKLVEEEIPANSREIGVARSYGDLRENAEYQAAKDHQGILHKRRAELETDLRRVRGSDFSDCSSDVVGPGTVVDILRPDGAVQKICVLGEWDRDEALGIISSQSRLAKLLEGHAKGDELMLPSDVGEEPCAIGDVAGLGDDIRDWIRAG